MFSKAIKAWLKYIPGLQCSMYSTSTMEKTIWAMHKTLNAITIPQKTCTRCIFTSSTANAETCLQTYVLINLKFLQIDPIVGCTNCSNYSS